MAEYAHQQLGSRIKAAMKAAQYKNGKQFCEKNNIKYLTFSQHIQGRRRPRDSALKKYSQLFNVNFSWLKTGDGPALKTNSSDKKTQTKETIIKKSIQEDLHKIKIINSDLLADILGEVFNLRDKHNLSKTKCAIIASYLYNEVIKSNDQKNAIKTFIKTYEATL